MLTDLVDMQKFSTLNKGTRYILAVINIFTKFVWTRTIKSKSAKDIIDAKDMFKIAAPPSNLDSNDKSEFLNTKFKVLMDKYKINRYATYSLLKAMMWLFPPLRKQAH